MKIDYSKMDAEYPYAAESYGPQREANDALVLNVVKYLGTALNIEGIETISPYGTHYYVRAGSNVISPPVTLVFQLAGKGKTMRLAVSPNYGALMLSAQIHELKDRESDTATVDLSRDPDRIANEIIRKVVQPYAVNRAALIERHKERQYAAGKRDAVAERIAKVFDRHISRDGGGKFTGFADVGAQENLSVYVPVDVPGHRFNVYPTGHVTVERLSLNSEQAVKLAEFLMTLKGVGC